jgi:hypothetical protein
MSRFLLLLALISLPSFAQVGEPDPLLGRVEGNTYISPTGAFRVAIPILPELGGRILDTDSTVTFQDDFNTLYTIAAVPMDATQRWEFSTRGTKDYLPYFFANLVLPDFRQAFPGTKVESAKYAASVADGALFAYTLLPGGSMFAHKLAFVDANQPPPEAKRGNLIFVRNNFVFVLSTELAERVTERSTYKKTPAEEEEILRQRLVDLLGRIQFPKPEITPTK